MPDADAGTAADMLTVEGLSAGYDGMLALHGVSLAVPRATITAVLGANGAGKTTLLRAVAGSSGPAAGGSASRART